MEFRKLKVLDVVVDEYKNYYQVVGLKLKETELVGLNLCNFFYRKSNTRIFGEEDLMKEYHGKYIGHLLVDALNHRIKMTTEKVGKIYTLSELRMEDIELTFEDVTEYKSPELTK